MFVAFLYSLNIYAEVQPFYLMIKYTNYLIIIFIKINENIRNERKSMGCIYKTTPISAAINYKFPNLVPNQSLDNFVLFCYLVSKLSNLKTACMLMKPLEMKAKLAEK